MKSFKEWKDENGELFEKTALPVTNEEETPTEEDWHYYTTKIQGRAAFLLNRFTDEVSKKPLTLVRKGFIVQEVLDALKMDVSQFVRVMGNIKKSIYQHQRNATKPTSVPSVPSVPAPTAPTAPTAATGSRIGAKASPNAIA